MRLRPEIFDRIGPAEFEWNQVINLVIAGAVRYCKTGNYLRMTGRYLRMAELRYDGSVLPPCTPRLLRSTDDEKFPTLMSGQK